MIIPFILGMCAAVLALLVQTPFAESSTLSGIVLLTFLEETIRFSLIFFAVQRNVFSHALSPAVSGILFGIGFAFVEILLLPSPETMHIFLLLLVHGTLSALTFSLLSLKKPWLWCIAYVFALALHIGYNIAVF